MDLDSSAIVFCCGGGVSLGFECAAVLGLCECAGRAVFNVALASDQLVIDAAVKPKPGAAAASFASCGPAAAFCLLPSVLLDASYPSPAALAHAAYAACNLAVPHTDLTVFI